MAVRDTYVRAIQIYTWVKKGYKTRTYVRMYSKLSLSLSLSLSSPAPGDDGVKF